MYFLPFSSQGRPGPSLAPWPLALVLSVFPSFSSQGRPGPGARAQGCIVWPNSTFPGFECISFLFLPGALRNGLLSVCNIHRDAQGRPWPSLAWPLAPGPGFECISFLFPLPGPLAPSPLGPGPWPLVPGPWALNPEPWTLNANP